MKRLLASCAAVSLLVLGLVACGGDDGDSDLTAQQVIDRFFENSGDVRSADLDLELSFEVTEGEEAGEVALSVGGPFQGEPGELPELDIEGSIEAEGAPAEELPEGELSAGVVLSGEEAFVKFRGDAYEVDQTTFAFIRSAFEQQTAQGTGTNGSVADAGAALRQLGVEPSEWFTEPELGEDGDVVTAEGSVNVDAVADSLGSLAEQAGTLGGLGGLGATPTAPTDEELEQVKEAIQDATYTVGVDAEDELPRLFELSGTVTNPEDESQSGSFRLRLALDEVNEEQTIETPDDARPLEELLGELGLDQLGGLGALGGLGTEESTQGEADAPDPDTPPDAPAPGGEGTGGTSPEDAEAYLECIQGATSPEELQECSEML